MLKNVLRAQIRLGPTFPYSLYIELMGERFEIWFRADLSSVWDPLTCCLPKRCMKDGLLDIQVAAFFAVNNFRIT